MGAVVNPEWVDHAACKDQHELFFDHSPTAIDAAKTVCSTCPVRSDCLADAIATEPIVGERHAGVRAGLDPDEVAQVVRAARRRDRYQNGPCGSRYGYLLHRSRGEDACDKCKAANATYSRSRYRAPRKRTEEHTTR